MNTIIDRHLKYQGSRLNSFQVHTNDLDTIRKECRQSKERSESHKHNATIISPRNDQQQHTKTLKIISSPTVPPPKRVKVDHMHVKRNQNWIVLKGLPNVINANDVKGFFKGLTILNMYVYYYDNTNSDGTNNDGTNNDGMLLKYANVYVEFSSNSGADLGKMRSGEPISINKTDTNDMIKVTTKILVISNKEASWVKGSCLRLVGNSRTTHTTIDFLRSLSPSILVEALMNTDPSDRYNTWHHFYNKSMTDSIYGCFDYKDKVDRSSMLSITAFDPLYMFNIDHHGLHQSINITSTTTSSSINKSDDIITVHDYITNILKELVKLKSILIRGFLSTDDIKRYSKSNDTSSSTSSSSSSSSSSSYILLDLCSRMIVMFEIINRDIINIFTL